MTINIKNYFSNLPTLNTERLILRKMEMRDAEDVYEYSSDSVVPAYLLWRPHTSLEESRRYVHLVKKYYAKKEFFDWALEHKESGKMIGTCGFSRIDEANLCAELGYVLHRAYWGQGLAVEAAKEVIRIGFEVLAFNRIEARYMIENHASARVLEKLGFTFEGVHRKSIFVKGQFRDIGYYALLKEDYRK